MRILIRMCSCVREMKDGTSDVEKRKGSAMREEKAIRIKGVIFDMDGCLIDSEVIHMENWGYAFEKHNFHISPETISHWRGMAGSSIDQQVNAITKDPQMTKALRKTREDRFFELLYAGKVHMKPYAIDALKKARELGYIVCLGTSTGKDKGLLILDELDLKKYFDHLTFGNEVENGKPAPDIFLLAARRMGISPEEAILFEDSENGVKAGVAAGITHVVHIPDNSVSHAPGDFGAWRQVPDFAAGIRIMEEWKE